MSDYLFIYGTLRHYLIQDMQLHQDTEFIGEASMRGRLYLLDGYPGAVDSVDFADNVVGELYRIRRQQALFSTLDDYEECSEKFPQPHEYRRELRPVSLADGRQIVAWVYLYNWDIRGLPQIVSGDFLGRDGASMQE
ncbi:gamma-glutamylcyclotransferase family protein [Methylophaga sp. OBS3]|uniref:gamma-glutamylcyclotransferase family protein n=1 Tax=Methylophaga sp. OBS3 TaxID=2991934 RepID=UPI00224ED23A|nr:gamma-glutamylcyclotransferase family protein [Methylophaga sp. OBS3]MCX4188799.1 gamma-glutamylcyclotransferase [Methylophaga sp. OBS3]